jgi:hypothetical protein
MDDATFKVLLLIINPFYLSLNCLDLSPQDESASAIYKQ